MIIFNHYRRETIVFIFFHFGFKLSFEFQRLLIKAIVNLEIKMQEIP